MEGLEISTVRLEEVLLGAETKRFDPEYFRKEHLADAAHAKTHLQHFTSFEALGLKVDGSAFYPGIEEFYGEGNLPFLRVADVDSVIDFEGCTRIPPELCDRFSTLSRVRPGDIVFTKGGSVARIGLVTQEAAASRDLIFLNSSKLSDQDRNFIYLYFQTGFFNRMLLRSSSQTAQPHLTITLVRNLPVFVASPSFKQSCSKLVQASFSTREEALKFQVAADRTLLRALGLEQWEPPEPLSYTRRASEVLTETARLDAEHWQVKFYAARAALEKAGAYDFIPMEELLNSITNGQTPLHHDLTIGEVPFLCAEHVSDFEVNYGSEKRVLLDHHKSLLARTALQNGDILITIKGRVGNAAIVEIVPGTVNINQDVALLRLNDRLPHWFVVAYLNSFFGKLAVEQHCTGAINPFLGLSNIRRLLVPRFDQQLMEKIGDETCKHVQLARAARLKAQALLAKAKRAVEVAIEEGERRASLILDTGK